MSTATQLGNQALEIGGAFKRREVDFQKQHDDAVLKAKEAEAQRDAASIAFKRSLDFRAMLGGEFQCPNCWVSQGINSDLRSLPSEYPDIDVFRCRICGHETSVYA